MWVAVDGPGDPLRPCGRSPGAAGAGAERVQAIQALKTAAAAVLAWTVAGWWWEARMAMMAPWSAVLIVRAIVYQSVRCAGQ